MLEQGESEKIIIEQCLLQNLPLPDKIKNAPTIPLGLGLYYAAFMDLTTCRTQGFGEGPISWISIKEYALLNELNEEQTEDLFFIIRKMDEAYLKHRAKKVGTKQPGK